MHHLLLDVFRHQITLNHNIIIDTKYLDINGHTQMYIIFHQ